MNTTAAAPIHSHDLGITVSVPELPDDQFVAVQRRLREALIQVVKDLGIEADVMTTFDGRRECDAHR